MKFCNYFLLYIKSILIFCTFVSSTQLSLFNYLDNKSKAINNSKQIFSSVLTEAQRNNLIYDRYKFTVLFGKTLCLNKPKTSICKRTLNSGRFSNNIMTIHGLWPYNIKYAKLDLGKKNVQPIVFDPQERLRYEKVWPSFYKNLEDFWRYEYEKHGIYYTIQNGYNDHKAYFNKNLKLYESLNIKDIINFMHNKYVEIMNKKNLKKKTKKIKNIKDNKFLKFKYKTFICLLKNFFGDLYFSFKCKPSLKNIKKQYLEEISIHLDLNFNLIKNTGRLSTTCNKDFKIKIPNKLKNK